MFSANWIMYVEDRFKLVRKVRDEVMIGEWGMDEKEVYSNRDYYAFHLIITDDDKGGEPIACARIRVDMEHHVHGDHDHDHGDEYICIGDIAVRKEYRMINYAELALRMLLYKAQKLSPQSIEAFIREDEFAMYKRFGFTEKGRENGKIHVAVPRDKVLWPSECKGDD